MSLMESVEKHSDNPLTFAEFFAGIGLVRMGLEAAGWKIAFANDLDPLKRDMYCGHFRGSDQHYNTTDVNHLRADEIPDVMLATASFPCTDLSLAGSRKGLQGKHSSAFYGFIRVLREMGDRKPPLVLLENVVGFLTSHNGNDFHTAMRELNELGYAVDPFILDAKWFTPQSRPRLFVVASQQPASEISVVVFDSRIRPPLVTDYILKHSDIHWRISILPDPPVASEMKIRDILENLSDDDDTWWNDERAEYFYNQLSERHRAWADAMIAKRTWSYATAFRRVRPQPNGVKRSMAELRTDGLAGCLRTPKGGSGRQILFKAGYGRFAVRLMTPRECARLMGANNFIINAPLNQALFGFGDAVCVPGITWIAENYLNSLANSYCPVQTSGV